MDTLFTILAKAIVINSIAAAFIGLGVSAYMRGGLPGLGVYLWGLLLVCSVVWLVQQST